jgi:Fe-S oxidoreductase
MSLKDYRPMMERCSNCLGCKWIPFDKIKSQRFGENCPSVCYYNFNTYSARGRFQLAQTILDGDAEYTKKVTEVVHSCTSCGACDVSCKICRYNLEPLDHNIALKIDAVEKAKTLPVQETIIGNLKKEQTMIQGQKRIDRMNWAKGIKVKDILLEKAEVLFFPGCKYSYEDGLTEKARAMVFLLQKAGADIGVLGKADACCAGRAYQMGFEKEFEQRANANIEAVRKSGAQVIVTPCSDCYYAFKRLYAKLGLNVEVVHIVEYLDRLIANGKIQFVKPVQMTVTYHDPCHLGRQGEPYVAWEGGEKKIRNQIHTWDPPRPRYNGIYGVYDAPRNILKAIPGLRFVEMERIREYSWCCGAGGGCSETLPEFSSWTAAERISEAEATGADTLVTACPWCESNFAGAKNQNGNKIKIYDIFDLVRAAL